MNRPPEHRSFQIQSLQPGEGARLRDIRLRALRIDPDSFATTLAVDAVKGIDDWKKILSSNVAYVATRGDEDVGLACGGAHWTIPGTALLWSVWVAPEARGAGAASSLIQSVIEWARAAGFQRLLLEVAEKNLAAISVYRRLGFVPNGVTGTLPPPREHVREFQMARQL